MTLCVFACKVDKVFCFFFVFFYAMCVGGLDAEEKWHHTCLTTVPWSILQPYSQ